MDLPDTRHQVLAELEAHLLRPDAVSEHFQGLHVVSGDTAHPCDGPGIGVRFRWREDPTTYCVVLPVALSPDGAVTRLRGVTGWPGYDVPDAAALADEADFLLMEELETGLVRRARRTHEHLDDGGVVVHLDVACAPDVMPRGFFVGSLWLGEASDRGDHLQRAGLDTSAALAALADGTLVSWLHAYVDNSAGAPYVGTAAVAWDDHEQRPGQREAARADAAGTDGSGADPAGRAGRAARLVTLQVRSGQPASIGQALLFHVLRDARDRGAASVAVHGDATRLHQQELAEAGFRPADTGTGLVLALADQRWPDLSV